MNREVATALWVLPLLVAWLWRPRQTLSASAWLLLVVFCALGAGALWFAVYADTGPARGFAFLKPTILYWSLAGIMLVAPPLGWGYPVKIIVGTYFALSDREYRWINRGFAALYSILGGVNLSLASDPLYMEWVDFKFSCMVNLLFIGAFRLNFVWLPILTDLFVSLYRSITTTYRRVAKLF